MREVSKEKFYREMMGRNVTPDSGKYQTLWKYPNGHVVGRTSIGYASSHGAIERFYVDDNIRT